MIKELRLEFPISFMCEVFDVSPSGYYRWCNPIPSKRALEEKRLELEIIAAHKRTRETFGPERLQDNLSRHGVEVGVHRIKRIRKKLGLRCIQKKKFKATTDSNHSLPVSPNLVDQDFTCEKPNEIWLTDITYIPTKEGWLYLAGHKDLFSGEIVGYSLGTRMTKSLVCKSLSQAVTRKRPGKGLIHHSDRGSQYCSLKYRKLLKQFGMKSSMSRKGNCYDNSPIESFWGTLKNELIHHRRYQNRHRAIKEITEFIEVFYNRQRTQKKLGFLSPVEFENQYYENKLAA